MEKLEFESCPVEPLITDKDNKKLNFIKDINCVVKEDNVQQLELDKLAKSVELHKTWFAKNEIPYTDKLGICIGKWVEILENEELENIGLELMEILTSINIMIFHLTVLLIEINSYEITKEVGEKISEIVYSNVKAENLGQTNATQTSTTAIDSIITGLCHRIMQLKALNPCESYLAQVVGIIDSIMIMQNASNSKLHTIKIKRTPNFLLNNDELLYYQSGGFLFIETLLVALLNNSDLDSSDSDEASSNLNNNVLIIRLSKLVAKIWAEMRKQDANAIIQSPTPKIQEFVQELDFVCELLIEHYPYSDEIETLVQVVKKNMYACPYYYKKLNLDKMAAENSRL